MSSSLSSTISNIDDDNFTLSSSSSLALASSSSSSNLPAIITTKIKSQSALIIECDNNGNGVHLINHKNQETGGERYKKNYSNNNKQQQQQSQRQMNNKNIRNKQYVNISNRKMK